MIALGLGHLLRSLLALSVAANSGQSSEEPSQQTRQLVDGEITFQHIDGVYLNLGIQDGLREGGRAWLSLDGRRVARIELQAVKDDACFARYLLEPRAELTRGTVIRLALDPSNEPAPSSRPPGGRRDREEPDKGLPRPGSTTRGPGSQSAQGFPGADDSESRAEGEFPVESEPAAFVPLLDSLNSKSGVTGPKNVFHGRIGFQQSSQWNSDALQDFQLSMLRTSGSVQRIDGGPWGMRWRADLSTRFGRGYERVRDFEEPRVDLHDLSFFRRYQDGSTLEVGRFVPRPLPGIGRMDAALGEMVLSERFRIGAVAGFQSDRKDGNLQAKEPTFAPYVSYLNRDGKGGDEHSITAGLLLSAYEGKADRMAFLVDQAARWGNLRMYSSTEVDVDIGSAETRNGARLTRQDLSVHWLRSGFEPRFGIIYDERPDIEAERDLLEDLILREEDFYNGTEFTRVWAGFRRPFKNGFYVDAQGGYDFSQALDTEHWRLRIGKNRLFGNPSANAQISVYRLAGLGLEGIGGRISGSWSTRNSRVVWMPSILVRLVDDDSSGDRLEVSEGALHAFWKLKGGWDASAGLSYTTTVAVQGLRALFGLNWRF